MTPEEIRNFLNSHDRFASQNGMILSEVGEGSATAEMNIANRHKNGVNSVHGGAIYTLADFAFACASNSYGQIAVAASTSITYHKAAFTGKLRAKATEISAGKNLASYRVEVMNDTDGRERLVATFTGLVYRLGTALQAPE